MKKLLSLTILLLIFTISEGQIKLWINDSVYIDTKGVSNLQVTSEESIKPLFNRYGMFIWHDAIPHDISLAMNDTVFQLLIPRKEQENIRVSGYYAWLNKWFSEVFNKRIGMETLYGWIYKEKFLPAGEHVINAWDDEYITYQDGWNIPTGFSQDGCNCAFDKSPNEGSTLTLTFNGRGIKVTSEKTDTHGIVNVYLDGKLVNENVDLYSENAVNPYTLYEVNNLDSKQHNVDIKVVGKNPKSSNYYFVLHRYEVTNERVEPETQVVYDTVRIENKVTVYDTVEVNSDYEDIEKVLISSHYEYHKALQSAIKEAFSRQIIYPDVDWKAVRSGTYDVYWLPDKMYIKQPIIEVK